MKAIKQMLRNMVVSMLQHEAAAVLRRYDPDVIAVVGSVGKTTTKDAVFHVLQAREHSIRKNEKSLNSDIGAPLTVLGLQNPWNSLVGWCKTLCAGAWYAWGPAMLYPKTLVLEVGADHPGDIYSIANWISVAGVVFTRWGEVPVHVEFFESPEALRNEDRTILKSLKKGGFVVLNADDADVMKTVVPEGVHTITYGFSDTADIHADAARIVYVHQKPNGMATDVAYKGSDAQLLEVKNVLGVQHIYPMLAALATGIVRGEPLEQAVQATHGFIAPRGRMNILEGKEGSVLIDDTYNSSPVAVRAALDTLADIAVQGTGRKIAVLGDMRELGSYSESEHVAIGTYCVQKNIDILVTVGKAARGIGKGARDHNMIGSAVIECDDAREAAEKVVPLICEHDVVLVKGSQGVRLEQVSKALLKNPAQASEVLVRQEEEWMKR